VSTADRKPVLEIATTLAGLAGYVYVLGGAVSWVRLGAAHLPADLTTSLFDTRILFAIGVRVVLISALLLGIACLPAYWASRPNWANQAKTWHAVRPRDDGTDATEAATDSAKDANFDEAFVRTVAGLNVLALGAILGLGVASLLQSSIPTPLVTVAFLVVWLGGSILLARQSAWLVRGKVHGWVAIAVVVVALCCELPIALLMLTALAIAASGRLVARLRRPRTFSQFVRSPLPWALAGVYALAALAFVATPPVTYPRAIVQTAAGSQVGGYLARTDDGVYLATCTPKSDGRSTDERVALVRGDSVQKLTVGGEPYRLDSGDRPSLASVLLRPFGVHASPPFVLRIELRALQPVCDAGERATSGPDQGLGAGVFTGRPSPGAAAVPGEVPIERTSPATLAQLARTYQPTVETTVADRFWPVSVSAVLADSGPDGAHTCLVIADKCTTQPPALSDLTASGSAADYLDFPAPLESNPTREYLAFTRGQGIDSVDALAWLSNPPTIKPWDTAQVYFYYAGSADNQTRYGRLPRGLIGLQYWFFYPYNYYPTRVERHLMLSLPLAGDKTNTDLHEGDWEHVVVLLDAATKKPRYLYFARHDKEGVTVPWDSPRLSREGSHTIVQAAFGGHPSYDNHCSDRPRALLQRQSSDWVVCGTGRYAFRATTTPLVDLARTSWSCWPGHFGQATASQRRNATLPDYDPRRWNSKVIQVAGPQSPLHQAENAGVCAGDPLRPERAFR
jgi:hypothetical protein